MAGTFSKYSAEKLNLNNEENKEKLSWFKKFHFSDYLGWDDVMSFLDDLIVMLQKLLTKDYKAAFNLMKCHSLLLVPLLGIGLEFIVHKLPLGELTQLVWVKIQFCLQAITCGLWLGLFVYFAFQCKDLYCIGKQIYETRKKLNSKEMEKQFDDIAENIAGLQKIDANIKKLKEEFDKCTDQHIDKMRELGEKILSEHKQANDYYELVNKILDSLANDLNAMRVRSQSNKDTATVAGTISGILVAVSIFTWWWCPAFAITAMALNGAVSIGSGCVAYEANKNLRLIEEKEKRLAEQRAQLSSIMDNIKMQVDAVNKRMETDDPLISSILNG